MFLSVLSFPVKKRRVKNITYYRGRESDHVHPRDVVGGVGHLHDDVGERCHQQ